MILDIFLYDIEVQYVYYIKKIFFAYFFFINVVFIILCIEETWQKEDNDKGRKTTAYKDNIDFSV